MKNFLKSMFVMAIVALASISAYSQGGPGGNPSPPIGGGPNCGADPDVSYYYEFGSVPTTVVKGVTFSVEVDEIGTGSTGFCSLDIDVELHVPYGGGTAVFPVGGFTDASTVNGTTVHTLNYAVSLWFIPTSSNASFKLYKDGVLIETIGNITIANP